MNQCNKDNMNQINIDELNSEELSRKFPLEILLLLIAISTNLLKDLLNPELIKFVNKNKIVKYFILLLIAHASSVLYLEKKNRTITNPIHLLWSLGIVLGFYFINRLNYRVIIILCLGFIIYYGSTNIINYYKYT
tara:strand:+ start:9634 stop:10038 length:405 start_codon:yes stop_codon:yes gene_type:complete